MRKSARTQIPPFFDNDPYTRSYAKSTLCRYNGENARPVTLPLFKEVIINDD